MILSEQIKLCRKQLGMSQADLADAIWVSRNTVSNWERGDTTPDIQSLVLMGALFGRSLDEIVKGDEQVMAQALERDKNHLLIAGETFNPGNRQAADWNHTTTLNLFELRSTGGPAHGKFEDADVTDSHGLAYRLVRIATLFSRSLYHILDEHGCKVGALTRKHALQGDEFSIVRNNSAIAHINARRALNRTAYGIEIVDDASAPLALGLTFAILMLRDYDRVWVRGAGKASI